MTDHLCDLAVRAARAEIERDALRKQLDQSQRTLSAFFSKDKQAMLDALHIMGIPARDLSDIFRMEMEWRKHGGSDRRLLELREVEQLRYRYRKATNALIQIANSPGRPASEIAREALDELSREATK